MPYYTCPWIMHERTCISVSIPVLKRALALCWSAWRRRSARVTPPRVSLTGWRTSWAAPAGWAAAASSRPTWAPKRSAAGGGARACERGMHALLMLWPAVCHVLESFWLSLLCFRADELIYKHRNLLARAQLRSLSLNKTEFETCT